MMMTIFFLLLPKILGVVVTLVLLLLLWILSSLELSLMRTLLLFTLLWLFLQSEFTSLYCHQFSNLQSQCSCHLYDSCMIEPIFTYIQSTTIIIIIIIIFHASGRTMIPCLPNIVVVVIFEGDICHIWCHHHCQWWWWQ